MKISKCCKAKVRKEDRFWVSKKRRQIFYCLKCGKPCCIKNIKIENIFKRVKED